MISSGVCDDLFLLVTSSRLIYSLNAVKYYLKLQNYDQKQVNAFATCVFDNSGQFFTPDVTPSDMPPDISSSTFRVVPLRSRTHPDIHIVPENPNCASSRHDRYIREPSFQSSKVLWQI